uniref:Uncharacterized protein n=1 Tax=Arundo donax TaxID=35708 RepID=A0A0A9CZN8_ARUDO
MKTLDFLLLCLRLVTNMFHLPQGLLYVLCGV